MNHRPALHIREKIFGFRTQQEFADALGYEQATISRWESGEIEMSRKAMDRIRDLAAQRGIRWDNNWFFVTANDFVGASDDDDAAGALGPDDAEPAAEHNGRAA